MPSTIASKFNTRANSLNALRLLFAAIVLISHAWAIAGQDYIPSFGGLELGQWGVIGFFAISGYLITRSRLSGQSAASYYLARAMRLLPGFLVCLLVTAFILAPLSLLWDATAAWSPGSSLSYLLRNAALYPPAISQTSIEQTLQNNPYPGMWNGSLWTLFWEAVCYVVVGVGVSVLPRKLLGAASIVILVFSTLLTAVDQFSVLTLPGVGGLAMMVLTAFAAGASVYFFEARLTINAMWVAVACGALIVAVLTNSAPVFAAVPFIYLLLPLSTLIPLHSFGAKADISYGFYVYAWPVQQLTSLALVDVIPFELLIVVQLLITAALAFLSFIVIERPCMDFARRHRGQLMPTIRNDPAREGLGRAPSN